MIVIRTEVCLNMSHQAAEQPVMSHIDIWSLSIAAV